MEQAYLTVASLNPMMLECTLCPAQFDCSGSSRLLVSSFVSHVRKAHPDSKDVNDAVIRNTEDASQAAARIVREATENK